MVIRSLSEFNIFVVLVYYISFLFLHNLIVDRDICTKGSLGVAISIVTAILETVTCLIVFFIYISFYFWPPLVMGILSKIILLGIF